MEIVLKWKYMGENNYPYPKYDTKNMKLICIPGRGHRDFGQDEMDALLCISDGMNYTIAEIHTGDVDSANSLCKEIVRRFNEFPEELKQ